MAARARRAASQEGDSSVVVIEGAGSEARIKERASRVASVDRLRWWWIGVSGKEAGVKEYRRYFEPR